MGGCHSSESEHQMAKQPLRGAQSLRGTPDHRPMKLLAGNDHAMSAFQQLFDNEALYCDKFGVFYHSYSHSALLYEVRAALGAILRGFDASHSPLPRLQLSDFQETPDANALMKKVATEWGPEKSDHHPEFRKVGISTMCSLLATGPECCMQVAFFQGYSCRQISFRTILEEEIVKAGHLLPAEAQEVVDELLTIASRHGLDTTILGGRPSPSGHAGHLMQIFIRLDLLDLLCYPAHPYGAIDEERLPISKWLAEDTTFGWGQARLLAHPDYFLDPEAVKLFTISADPTFHQKRHCFQEDMQSLLSKAMHRAAERHRELE
mmetsp:Transcript_69902/g.146134  ORF Transcript_69902/g.146134 Transcript_69902/m.146134 type:complete len:320 (-) Transcript_69902:134-1093(-)|eukprot:CAMPEP_0206467884 /NCGR_PEP_ID=MMETSP0324_2-20121206/29287_1 /ASSEMBLY_ACC=CAM_ASM_000836 /TAXON_ID=2866 /ORGANISM="Crypthecodinium cohnii, Strain Seligo" /LENGTH=319 /DNA_ID=CAMNT_0053941211 /DNA_START=163 /DNA_END=1122 /DNA_ORIENTATION=+